MSSRGYQRQFRRARAEIRKLRRAYIAAHPAPELPAVAPDPRFPGLDGLMSLEVWCPYPFGDGWTPSVTGTIGGRARTNPLLVAQRKIITEHDEAWVRTLSELMWRPLHPWSYEQISRIYPKR